MQNTLFGNNFILRSFFYAGAACIHHESVTLVAISREFGKRSQNGRKDKTKTQKKILST